jgi:formamidopyrimidine-DNA glycosylase
MPELPEVESLRRILVRAIKGRRVISAEVREPRLRRAVAPDLAARIVNHTITGIGRRAKYLLIELDGDNLILMVHLGMSGSLTHRNDGAALGGLDPRHDHVSFTLDDCSLLVYNDPRRFGLMTLLSTADCPGGIAELARIGPEPLGSEFTADYLWKVSRGRAGAIKNLLMDQQVVAGVGNIYASEILFRAGVRPTRPAGRVTRVEAARIAALTPQVLREAIGDGGTTFRSYRDARGRPGRFVDRLQVYDREGKPCVLCGTLIRAVVVGQRSSYFCPHCQK